MAEFDMEALLEAVSPDQPCGDDLEYDPAYGELERAAQGKAEQSMGDTVIPGEEPDWAEVSSLSRALLARSKDLRIAVHLTRAELGVRGLPGLADGLGLVHGLLERHWEQVFPLLDPDDDDDPTLRVNTIAGLCAQDAMLRPLRDAVLITSRAFGPVTYRNVAMSSGELSPAGGAEAPDPAAIEAAFQDCDLEALGAAAAASRLARERLTAIDELLTERVGTSAAPDLEPLHSQLRAIDRVLGQKLALRGAGDGEETAGGDEAAPVEEGEMPRVSGGASAGGVPGSIASRDDVVRALDRICDYYARQEPSSPIPHLLRRARRLVNKDFIEIMRDIAPDGLSQAEQVTGADSGYGED